MMIRDFFGAAKALARASMSAKVLASLVASAFAVTGVATPSATPGGPASATPGIAVDAQAAPSSPGVCEQKSHPRRTAALIELYTSQGCSSCPPADRWLSGMADLAVADALRVPLSLHVDYWDYIGWRDPYARAAFTLRQRWTAERNNSRTIYTPGVFADGAEWRDWPRGGERRIGAINARPPLADIRVSFTRDPSGGSAGQVDVDASRTVEGSRSLNGTERAALFVALTESGLANRVTAGENNGEKLVHDHVARLWYGPIELKDGRATVTEPLAWPTGSGPQSRLAVVAFVQDLNSGRVLQATRLPLGQCGAKVGTVGTVGALGTVGTVRTVSGDAAGRP